MKRDWVLVSALSAALAGAAMVAWTLSQAAAPPLLVPKTRTPQAETVHVIPTPVFTNGPRQLHDPADCAWHVPQLNVPEGSGRP